MNKWQEYSEKYQRITDREKYLILATGLFLIIFMLYSLLLDSSLEAINKLEQQITQTKMTTKSNTDSITLLEQSLSVDPNVVLEQELEQYREKLAVIDSSLLKLTSDLINPVEMRHALAQLLQMQKGVKLLSFEVLAAEPILSASSHDVANNEQVSDDNIDDNIDENDESLKDLHLYRHGIRIKLSGRYFQLRDYLSQLESLSWKFFWHEFDYQLKKYPVSELVIEIYSLSTAEEFIGV